MSAYLNAVPFLLALLVTDKLLTRKIMLIR